jgi:hypothetical protein
MEPPRSERARPPSTRGPGRPPQQTAVPNTRSSKESPFPAKARVTTTAPARKRKRRQKQDPEGEFWTIKSILGEKQEDGKSLYFVDWADNSQTGESYDPSWTDEVTEDALREWEERKQSEAERESGPAQTSSPESQPIQPAKRQKTVISNLKSRSTSRRRGASNPRHLVAVEEQSTQREIKDSWEEDGPLTNSQPEKQPCVVVSPIGSSFDRGAYNFVQSSPVSQTSHVCSL